ncbi:hypothetical protein [Streptomyces sp. NPDC046197]|uniref:hypothetical protein n=1 Tax=Streptomyces sp. NPDC046197 TaxID=3154337 RepID=UPI00340B7C04
MARAHRFHVDLQGHSVTVQTPAGRETELLVDGKVVGHRRTAAGHRGTRVVLSAELPGDPPEPFTVVCDAAGGKGGTGSYVLEVAGRTHAMPQTPVEHPAAGPAHWLPPRLRRIRRLLYRSLLARTGQGR